MTDLIAFIRARLDADREAIQDLHRPDCANAITRGHEACSCDVPARAHREVAYKRWTLAQHEHRRFAQLQAGDNEAECPPGFPGTGQPYVGCVTCDYYHPLEVVYPSTWCGYLRHMATAWSEHPDYQAEWAP